MPRCFENGNGDFGPEAFWGHTLRRTKHKWSSGFMVLDVSYSRVLGQLVCVVLNVCIIILAVEKIEQQPLYLRS